MEVEEHVRGSTDPGTHDAGVHFSQDSRTKPVHYGRDNVLEPSRNLQKVVDYEP